VRNCNGDRLTATRTSSGQSAASAPGAAQHQAAEPVDQAGILGDGDELRRRNHAAFGVRPPHQRLEAGDVPGREIDQRLVIGAASTSFWMASRRPASILRRLWARASIPVSKKLKVPREIVLGARQRHVGILEKFFGLVAIAGAAIAMPIAGANSRWNGRQTNRDRRSPPAAFSPARPHRPGASVRSGRIANSSELRRASVSSSRNVDRRRLATARKSLSPMPLPSGIVDRLEVIEA